MAKPFRLTYLPIFYQDLNETVTYISEILENVQAANDLLDETEKAIKKRLPEADEFLDISQIEKDHIHTIRSTSKTMLYTMLSLKRIWKRSWKSEGFFIKEET